MTIAEPNSWGNNIFRGITRHLAIFTQNLVSAIRTIVTCHDGAECYFWGNGGTGSYKRYKLRDNH
jgi:hypothetical protein